MSAGAILTQHTAWTNAAAAIAALRARRLLTARAIDATREDALATVIRAAGTYRLKARRLRAFTRWLVERFGGSFSGLRAAPLGELRGELLGVSGLGPETVDAILLYAAGRPVFVADAYARRVLGRHGVVPTGAGYEDVRRFVEEHLPSDPRLYNEYHALLVAVGKTYCRTLPRCDRCPLRADLRSATRSAGAPPRALRGTPPARRRDALPRRAPRARGRARPSP